MDKQTDYIRAQALIHHAYLLGLQLMVAANKGPQVMGDWMYGLFRRQHHEKFLSSFEKLGLCNLPHAVACAQYHTMANSVGGVPVEYMYESDNKAWVRFRYPRWMYQGPVICGIPVEVSRGFLQGWYAHNGVSLNNPRLGFVCVSEDMTGEFGLCGYFQEFDYELTQEQRLQFARGERPPPFKASEQPKLSALDWSEERLQKANRNYAMEFIRNGLPELVNVIGKEDASQIASRAARLIGLQYLPETLAIVDCKDGDASDAGAYIKKMFQGMGDDVELTEDAECSQVKIVQKGLRIVRGLSGDDREMILNCWQQLWAGALASYRGFKSVAINNTEHSVVWTISDVANVGRE